MKTIGVPSEIEWRTELQGPEDDTVPVQCAELGRYELAVMPTLQGEFWPRDPDYDPAKKWDWLVRVIGIGVVGNGHAHTEQQARDAAETRARHLLATLASPGRTTS